MSNKLYDILNKTQRWLPALGAFYVAIGAIWALPFADEINKTIAAIATLLAATLEIFSARWYQDNKLIIESNADGITDKANIE